MYSFAGVIIRDMKFQDWYDMFFKNVRKGGYRGPVYKDSAKEDFNKGVTAEDAANSFIIDMTE